MKDIWVLSVKTSLPKTAESIFDIKTTMMAFDTFEKGREAMRKVIREYAFSKNAMFDGEGNIIQLKNYINDMPDEEYIDDDYDVLDKNTLNYVANSLRDAFSGKDFEFEMPSEYCTDYIIALEFLGDSITIHGEDDGPFNGFDPKIHTNIFSMKEEWDYYLYIDDLLGQNDCSSELYIDLKKTVLE